MPAPRDFIYLNPEQFDKLVELLTPGYVLAKMYLDQHNADAVAKMPEPAQGDSGDVTK